MSQEIHDSCFRGGLKVDSMYGLSLCYKVLNLFTDIIILFQRVINL